MGFHLCQYCGQHPNPNNRFNYTSSGDVFLTFSSGTTWEMPDMILHYIADHHWQPPQAFVDDVMNSEVTHATRLQTKGLDNPRKVGYLDAQIQLWGKKPQGFVEKLEKLMESAVEEGQIALYRNKNIIPLEFLHDNSWYIIYVGIQLPLFTVVLPNCTVVYLNIHWEEVIVNIEGTEGYKYPLEDFSPSAIASILGGLVAEPKT
jgi:hypothetical protein